MATIVDVAREAGVSKSTVSHVLNRTRKVDPKTIARVEAAIATVGYTPNIIAQSLARSTTATVGIAISAISNPYFSDIICAIETECSRLGLMVFLSDTQDDPEQELRVVRALHRRRVDGILLAPSADPEHKALNYILQHKIPCVLVDRLAKGPFDQVGVQNRESMQALVAHLIQHGHKRIGLIAGQPGFATTLERIEGFKAAFKASHLAIAAELINTGNNSVADAMRSTTDMLRSQAPPTALAAGNNLATIGAMRAIRNCGMRVPRDIALVAFDDFEWADSFEPRLTAVAQPVEEIGRRAAALLVKRIENGDHPEHQTVRLKPTLIIRNSCGCVSDPNDG